MAHIAKFNKGATGNMFSHYDRSRKNISENIDWSRTEQNYNLATYQQLGQLDFLHQRLSEVKVQNRKDVNVFCDWIVTAPKDLEEYNQKAFFQRTYEFLEKKYGKENIISAYVHLDEVTPHLHFNFIPVVQDLKKGGYKVSAKECITREDLKTFHTKLEKHLNNYSHSFGQKIKLLNGATIEGNQTISELKKNNQVVKKELNKLQGENKVIKKELDNLQKENKILKGLEIPNNTIFALKPRRTFTGSIKDISLTDIENLKKTAATSAKWKITALELKDAYETNRATLDRVLRKYKELEKENKELKPSLISRAKEKVELHNTKNEFKQYREKLDKVLDQFPEDVKEQFIEKWNITKDVKKNKNIGDMER